MPLKSLNRNYPYIQCSASVEPPTHNRNWRIERYGNRRRHVPSGNTKPVKPECCQLQSHFEIDGKPYCRRHASMIAMNRWENGLLVEPYAD